jgi:hypothetical protein
MLHYVIKACGSVFNKTIYYTFDFIESNYYYIDRILDKIVDKFEIDGFNVIKTENGFIFSNGKEFAHGKTMSQARRDLIFKITERDTEQYKNIDLKEYRTTEYLYSCYRNITGSCSFGTEDYIESHPDTEELHSIEEVIKHTSGNNAYRSDVFRNFFENN